MQIKKYTKVITTSLQKAVTYRFTMLTFRLGEAAEITLMIALWYGIFQQAEVIRGYTFREMTTYFIVGTFINLFVINWVYNIISRDIRDGKLSLYLSKPLDYLWYAFFRMIGSRIVVNLLGLPVYFVIYLFFSKFVILNFDVKVIGVILLLVGFGMIIEYFISYLVALIAFWTTEIAGLYSTINRLRKFFSGGYFPISLLPVAFVKVSMVLPFAYSFFVPTQLYLGKIDLSVGLKGLAVQATWIVILYLLIKIVWKKGLKKYESVGI